MTWATELVTIRRFLRDPDGTIWSDTTLRHLYNDVQQDFQHKTGALEDIYTQRVPGHYQFVYMYDWEYQRLDPGQSQFYQCLQQHDDAVFCHRWEPQQTAQTTVDVADYGIHFTQPWESCMSEIPGEPLRIRFPSNFNTVKFIAYDEEPIEALSKKSVQADPSWVTNTGSPIGYYPFDEADNTFVLYPRPSTTFANELSGDGLAYFAQGDTEDTTQGEIAVRTGSTDSSSSGVSLDIIDSEDNVFLVYGISPHDITGNSDDSDFPHFMQKYVACGVIGRAYRANTDGRIKSLADIWDARYKLGVEFVKKYLRMKRADRDYRLTTSRMPVRNPKHPRLPDTYPAV